MAFNTGNPIGSNDARDLSDNAENFDLASISTTDTFQDRLSVTRDTITGRIKKMGFDVPIPYIASIVFATNDNLKTVDESGVVYAPLPSALPFTTSGTFVGDDDARFFVVQSFISFKTVKSFATLLAAKSDTGLIDGDSVDLIEHTLGNLGGAIWIVVSGETANGFDIVDHDTLPLQLKLRVDGKLHISRIGGIFSTPTDNSAHLKFASDNYGAVHLPNSEGQQYGVSSPWEVLTRQGLSITTDNPVRSIGQVLKPLVPMEAVIQLLDGSATPGQNIITLPRFGNMSIDGDNKATIGLACGKFGATVNQLVKMLLAGSLSVARCRFGVTIGGADAGIETDSAGYGFDNLVIEECTDGGVLIDTGNGAAIRIGTSTLNGNGFNPTTDSFNPSGDGFNGKVIGGEFNMDSCTTSGAGAAQPATADIISNSGALNISGLWSDTHGICIKESGSTSPSFLGRVRHHEGGMNHVITGITLGNPTVIAVSSSTIPFILGTSLTLQDIVGTTELNGNTYDTISVAPNSITIDVDSTLFGVWSSAGLISSTPISIDHTGKIAAVATELSGRVKGTSGNSGVMIIQAPTWVAGGMAKSGATAYEGDLYSDFKAMVVLGDDGRGQVKVGGCDDDVPFNHVGFFSPQFFGMGAGNSTTGPTCVGQFLGGSSIDSGFTLYLDEATGTLSAYINCVKSDNLGNVAPILTTKDSHIFDFGGGTFSVMGMRRHKFVNTTPVSGNTFQTVFELLQAANDSLLSECVLKPPQLSVDPTFSSGPYWRGGFYYNTTNDEFRFNNGTIWGPV